MNCDWTLSPALPDKSSSDQQPIHSHVFPPQTSLPTRLRRFPRTQVHTQVPFPEAWLNRSLLFADGITLSLLGDSVSFCTLRARTVRCCRTWEANDSHDAWADAALSPSLSLSMVAQLYPHMWAAQTIMVRSTCQMPSAHCFNDSIAGCGASCFPNAHFQSEVMELRSCEKFIELGSYKLYSSHGMPLD